MSFVKATGSLSQNLLCVQQLGVSPYRRRLPGFEVEVRDVVPGSDGGSKQVRASFSQSKLRLSLIGTAHLRTARRAFMACRGMSCGYCGHYGASILTRTSCS